MVNGFSIRIPDFDAAIHANRLPRLALQMDQPTKNVPIRGFDHFLYDDWAFRWQCWRTTVRGDNCCFRLGWMRLRRGRDRNHGHDGQVGWSRHKVQWKFPIVGNGIRQGIKNTGNDPNSLIYLGGHRLKVISEML